MNASSRTVLVLGGSYFIGRRTVEHLRAAEHRLFVLNRGSKPLPGVTQLVADRSSVEAMTTALSGKSFDAVIDFSCYTRSDADVALAALGGRFDHWITISSSAVYTDASRIPMPEESATGGSPAWGAYGVDKSAAEDCLRASPHAERITILRPPYVYGPGNSLERETFVWSRIARGRPIFVPGSGETVVQWLHVDDLASAIDACLQAAQRAKGKTFNVGHQSATTLSAWVETLARVAGIDLTWVPVPAGTQGLQARAFFPLRDLTCFVDPARAKRELNWIAATDLKHGLATTYRSYDGDWLKQRPLDLANEDLLLTSLCAKS